MINNNDDTISAIATVLGNAGVSIIRLSGEYSVDVINRIFFVNQNFSQKKISPNSITHGYIYDDKTLIDEVIVLYFKSPNSYTGEDVFEIQCHGGVNVTKNILDLTLKNGARLAERGEFTKRAFMNGKLDLSQAEAVLDIISAKTKKFAKLSAANITGKLSAKINKIRDDVITLLTHIVAAIDFPEEVEEPDYDNIRLNINNIIDEIDTVLSGSVNSNVMRMGVKIAIAGKPNVGKSSLFNSILDCERAIVTDVAGTTRDVISENIDIKGIPATIIDTAGIRDIDNSSSSNRVENIGIEYSKRSIDEADVVLFVTDLSEIPTREDDEIYNLINDKKHLVIGTKSDLKIKNDKYDASVHISNLTKTGLKDLIDMLSDLIIVNTHNDDTEFLTNVRQQESLLNAKKSLKNALNGVENCIEQDFVSIDIKSALMYLGEITGDDINQEILNNIFNQFCIGK